MKYCITFLKYAFSILSAVFAVNSFSYAQSQNCNCPANEFGYSKAKKADTVFHLSNDKSIALYGSKDTEIAKGRTFYSEFVLAACGEKNVIKFWGAVLECQLKVKKNTLIVETVDSLTTGKNMRYKWTVWTMERIYFKNGKAVKDFKVNRQMPKYNAQEIQSTLKQYEESVKKDEAINNPNRVNNVNMEIADKLFISAISGSRQAREYLKHFRSHFGGLDGEYLEWYDNLTRKMKEWDTNTSANEYRLYHSSKQFNARHIVRSSRPNLPAASSTAWCLLRPRFFTWASTHKYISR